MVECYWPEITEEQARQALDRVALTPGPTSPADGVRPLGCILVPADGMVFFLFRGPSEDLVRERSKRAEVPFDRIVESIQIVVAD